MQLQDHITPVHADDFPRLLEVWEASVRETHHFLSEADIQFFKPFVRDAVREIQHLACVRASDRLVAGFIGVADTKVEMLFVHPAYRGSGIGRRLLTYAVQKLNATSVDVNEQNEQAVGFYVRMGFEVEARSDVDSTGRPFPLLHLRLRRPAEEA